MTPEELESIGCKKMHWNPKWNGGFFEYYLPLKGDGFDLFDRRLSVRIGDDYYKHNYGVDFMAVLVVPQNIIALEYVKTIWQFAQMYALLSGKPAPNPACSRPAAAKRAGKLKSRKAAGG